MKATATVILLICLALPVFADKSDDRFRTYNQTYDQIWNACIASASENFVIIHSDKPSGTLTFKTGISFTSAGFEVGVALKQTPENGVIVHLNPQAKGLGNWGAGGRIIKKFFKGVNQYLKDGKAKV